MKKLSFILLLSLPACFADSKFGTSGDEIVMPYVGKQVPNPDLFKRLRPGDKYSTELCRGQGAISRRKLFNQLIEKSLKNTNAILLKDAKITGEEPKKMFRTCMFITAIPMYDGEATEDHMNDAKTAK